MTLVKLIKNSIRGGVALISLTVASGVGLPAQAQLVVNPLNGSTVTATDLANALLGSSSGVTVSNVQFVGNNVQGGLFGGGVSAGLDFNDGIVLSSGNIKDLPLPLPIPVPQEIGFGASGPIGSPGDLILNSIVFPLTTKDAAVLKFDFVPTGNKVAFTYQFGSTEYNSFVNTAFNDVFAFLVNGVKYAFVPGTTTPVSINNVNCGQSKGATSAGSPGSPPVTNCNFFENNRYNDILGSVGITYAVNLGGFTKKGFAFIADVNPNVTNTMYLAIADTNDELIDSGVFLKGGSFTVCGGPGQSPCDGETTPEPSTILGLGALGFGAFLQRKLTKAKESNKVISEKKSRGS